jgi:thiol-disulfide isomerase/thioredoxin
VSEPKNLVNAPELKGGVAWLNTDAPWTLARLKGQVVLLDFWTYGCVNCLHEMPVLAELEDRFAGRPFVVIGVHSAKFVGEQDANDIELAIEQYDIRHPVVVDSALSIWNAYKVSAWPTAVIIDAQGKLRYFQSGEYSASTAATRIEGLLDQAACQGVAAAPVSYLTNPNATSSTPLLFPGGVLALPDGRVAIADSSHHRVVVMQSEGVVGDVFGSGVAGYQDGSANDAELFNPQGLAFVAGTLYVADAGNHAIRALDLTAKTVTNVAGTGAEGVALTAAQGWLPATTSRLNSPWDLEPLASGIAVALAGVHQLALFDPAGARFRLLSGTGDEGLVDGTAATCEYAQPSALSPSADGATLYVADPESSAVRAVTVADGSCKTLVGKGLFTYGDQDGTGDDVLLQHVSGLETLDDGDLLLADTYNSKIKDLVPATRTVTTVDWPPPALATDEPRAISRLGQTVYVADTNHHRILSHDLGTGDTHVFDLGDLAPPNLLDDGGASPKNVGREAGAEAGPGGGISEMDSGR